MILTPPDIRGWVTRMHKGGDPSGEVCSPGGWIFKMHSQVFQPTFKPVGEPDYLMYCCNQCKVPRLWCSKLYTCATSVLQTATGRLVDCSVQCSCYTGGLCALEAMGTMQSSEMHCSALQCIAVHCSALQCIAVHHQCIAAQHHALQCTTNALEGKERWSCRPRTRAPPHHGPTSSPTRHQG